LFFLVGNFNDERVANSRQPFKSVAVVSHFHKQACLLNTTIIYPFFFAFARTFGILVNFLATNCRT
jgi:hypothetical protein